MRITVSRTTRSREKRETMTQVALGFFALGIVLGAIYAIRKGWLK
jgi:hypothetical protein